MQRSADNAPLLFFDRVVGPSGTFAWIAITVFDTDACPANGHQIFRFLRRNALPMTETELRLIAAAASIGLSNKPNTG